MDEMTAKAVYHEAQFKVGTLLRSIIRQQATISIHHRKPCQVQMSTLCHVTAT